MSDAFLKANGKLPTFASGSTKWLKIVAIANMYQRQWAREEGVNWNSLYDPNYSLGSVTATDTFDLDDEIRTLSKQEGDFVRVERGTNQYTNYTIVPSDRLKEFNAGNYCAQVGRTLKFNQTFLSSSAEYGKPILAPVYLYPETFEGDNDEIVVDDPDWLVLVTAAEYIRNDITKSNQYGNLIAEANTRMARMKEDQATQDTSIYTPWSPTQGGML